MHSALRGRLLAVSPGDLVLLPDADMIAAALARLVGREEAGRILATVSPLGLLSASPNELVHVAGIGADVADRLVAARELTELLLRVRPPIASSSERLLAALPPGLATLEFEVLLAIALGPDLAVRAVVLVAKGGASSVSCTRREILTPLVRLGASRFVMLHNHPSRDPMPSREDLAFTASLIRAAREIDMELIDHIVIARDGFVSLADLGMLTRLSVARGAGDAQSALASVAEGRAQ